MNRILKKVSLYIIGFVFLLFLGLIIWLNARIDKVVGEDRYKDFIQRIDSSESLPERFYSLYEATVDYKSTARTRTKLMRAPWDVIFNQGIKTCPCMEANYGFVLKMHDRLTIGLALDRDVSPIKCLDYYLSRTDFLNGVIGVKQASRYYYNKEIEELTDDEILEISIMVKNSVLYNKKRFPDNLEIELQAIKIKLKN